MMCKFMLPHLFLALVTLVVSACGTPQPTPTQAPQTDTPEPSATLLPTDIPPTEKPVPTLTSTPFEQSNLLPSPRGEAPLAYDSKRNLVILFGGAIGNPNFDSSMNGETWIYDVAQNTWIEVKPSAPPTPRDNVLLAYDVESDRVILFGGASPSRLCMQETWSFDMDTREWTKMERGPAMCLGASMAYDNKADRMIVFGGWDFETNIARNETWAYDYNTNTWTNLKPEVSPPGHQFASMVYDSKADRVIMWGGWGTTKSEDEVIVWIYDYNTNIWEKREVGQVPTSRAFHTMTYDSKMDRTILYGGYTGGYPTGAWQYTTRNSEETWAYNYDLNTWTLLAPPTNPGPLSLVGQVYVSSISRVLLFGGKIDLAKHSDKMWLFDFETTTWTEIPPNP